MRKNIIGPITAAVLLAAAGAANALTVTTSFTVSAEVVASCSVDADDLSFGAYDASAPLSSSADIAVSCSNGTPYTVSLSPGNSGDATTRTLASGLGDTLGYNLYLDATHTSVWGDGNGGTGLDSDTGQGMSLGNGNTHTVYGLLPNSTANQDAPAGNYTDLITVTVEY